MPNSWYDGETIITTKRNQTRQWKSTFMQAKMWNAKPTKKKSIKKPSQPELTWDIKRG